MENTIVENAQPAPAKPVWLDLLQSYLQPGKLLPLLAIIASIPVGLGLLALATKGNYVPLNAGLERQDSAKVMEFLTARNEAFTIDNKTGLILVPAAKASQLQIELASMGLSQSTVMGLELLRQDQPLGTSQFMEQARYRHALETELSRTVSAMRNVDSARIHLAIPKRSVFAQRQSPSSGSVMVKMLPGRNLESGQVKAIVNLVSASIPYLSSADVTIVDEWGELLSKNAGSGLAEITAHQFEFSRKLEEHYAQRIEDLLTPLVGTGRVRASVSADLDFTVEEQTAESFEADPAQIRSEQQQQRSDSAASATGVPGALTNQPPVGGNQENNDEAGQNTNNTQVTNLTRNYELDKRISHVKNSPGKINRLSASVVIDNLRSINEAGESVNVPPTEQEIAEFTALVEGVIGFNEERGDSILVFNKPFQAPAEIEPPEAAPMWQEPWVKSLARQLGLGIIILAIIMFVVRPALVSLQPAKQLAHESTANEAGAETPTAAAAAIAGAIGNDTLTLSHEGASRAGNSGNSVVEESHGDILLMARNMAREDPKRVAKVVKDWVAMEAQDG
ncbi:MAG: flagellar basal-body MS-ring/collar protein FliF [Pseudomonadota bacterium]